MALQVTRAMDSLADILTDQSVPEEVAAKYDHYMERLENCIQKKNVDRFLEIFEEFIRDLFLSLL